MENLKNILDAMEIREFQDEEGNYFVVSSKEPSFCFVRKSHEEIENVVSLTLKSYARHFHNSEMEFELGNETVTPPKTVKLEQRSKFRPSFGFGNKPGAYITA